MLFVKDLASEVMYIYAIGRRGYGDIQQDERIHQSVFLDQENV